MYIKSWLNWRLIRAHLCTFAISVSFTSTWRLPRDAFRYGGLVTSLVYTVAMVVVAMSSVLLQLALGQLSQQDTVGVWRAVPFFTGIGYIKLLSSLVYSLCTISYLAVCVTYFFFVFNSYGEYLECPGSIETTSNSLLKMGPLFCMEGITYSCFRDNVKQVLVANSDYSVTTIYYPKNEENATIYNISSCNNVTILASVKEEPEYFVAMALIVIVLWLLFPFVLYNPVKWVKRIFYVFGPMVFLIGVVIVSGIGERTGLSYFISKSDWNYLTEPNIWHAALTQALLSSQVANGYLVSSGDSIYSSTDVEWSSLGIVGANIITCWCSTLFWFSISGHAYKDNSNLAVLAQTLHTAIDKRMLAVWLLLILFMLILSGIISMLTLLYPMYDRARKVGGAKWRYITVSSSVVAAAVTLAVLAVGHPLIFLLEEIIGPLLVALSTSVEIYALVFIYGWKNLAEDVEFLTERKLLKFWLLGWYVAPAIVILLTIWWASSWFIEQPNWDQPPWPASGLVTALCLSLFIITALGIVSIAKQVQYDIITKIKSAFKPSRHWGPRDPITHYYWLSRRDEPTQNATGSRYRRRKLGQFSNNSSLFNIVQDSIHEVVVIEKKRANSDDILFTQRKHDISAKLADKRRRSKSLDWSSASENKNESCGDTEDKTGTRKTNSETDSK